MQPPNFLADPTWQKPSVVLLTLWKNTGFTMVIYLAALQGVPESYYESAMIDGANAWQRFWRITIPMISPTTFFIIVLSVIGSFQSFDQIYVMTEGGPARARTRMPPPNPLPTRDCSRVTCTHGGAPGPAPEVAGVITR